MLETTAPAKINLYLHVTGRREDGYHLLDSLVAFTHIGDQLRLEPAKEFTFSVEGPMARALATVSNDDNLVVRAAKSLARTLDKKLNVSLTLVKNLPVASGIGGGSTDAAATLRLLAVYWGLTPNAAVLFDIAASLGQDIPCCLAAQTCYFRDIGNVTDTGPALPLTHIVLVNPGIDLPTPAVFKARSGPFSPARRLESAPETPFELARALEERGNDLTAAAISLCPAVKDVLDALALAPDCMLARMSGSGATCFGLFPDRSAARQAAAQLLRDHARWWVTPTCFPSEPVLPLQRTSVTAG